MARLLVSVSNPDEARAAIAGGADIVDAKDPRAGALGAVRLEQLRRIRRAVPPACPLSAATGDAILAGEGARVARAAATLELAFVKLGFLDARSPSEACERLLALREVIESGARAGRETAVVAVAYADAARVGGLDAEQVLVAARQAGARGVLLDTAVKGGPPLFEVMSPAAVTRLVARAHRAGQFVALAGKLDVHGIRLAAELGADVVGVRGAACEGGRVGRVSEERVRELAAALRPGAAERTFAPAPPGALRR